MKSTEFLRIRHHLGKVQQEMSLLLGVSLTAVHSYEQGWRNVPGHVERHLLLLTARKLYGNRRPSPCWKRLSCPVERRQTCPAWEFNAGDICWLINGTTCQGKVQSSWRKKMQLCRSCSVLRCILDASRAQAK